MIGLSTYPLVFSDQSLRLLEENLAWQGTAGVSENNRQYNFSPAFLDLESGSIYLSCYANGELAPIHLYDGLPDSVVLERNSHNTPVKIKSSVMSGFVYAQRFYTREQANRAVESLQQGKQILSA